MPCPEVTEKGIEQLSLDPDAVAKRIKSILVIGRAPEK